MKKPYREATGMNWKDKSFLFLLGGLAGMFLASEVFDDDDSDSFSEEDSFDADDGDY